MGCRDRIWRCLFRLWRRIGRCPHYENNRSQKGCSTHYTRLSDCAWHWDESRIEWEGRAIQHCWENEYHIHQRRHRHFPPSGGLSLCWWTLQQFHLGAGIDNGKEKIEYLSNLLGVRRARIQIPKKYFPVSTSNENLWVVLRSNHRKQIEPCSNNKK